jgi:hypothetical protein
MVACGAARGAAATAVHSCSEAHSRRREGLEQEDVMRKLAIGSVAVLTGGLLLAADAQAETEARWLKAWGAVVEPAQITSYNDAGLTFHLPGSGASTTCKVAPQGHRRRAARSGGHRDHRLFVAQVQFADERMRKLAL